MLHTTMYSGKKVLIVANYLNSKGGIAVQVEYLYNNLKQEGFCVSIFSTKGSTGYRLICPLLLIFKGFRFPIFHVHACSDLGFFPAIVGVLVGRLLGKKVILTFHGGDAGNFLNRRSKPVKWIVKKAHTFVTLSPYLQKIFLNYGINSVIVPNVVKYDETTFRNRETFKPSLISIRSLEKVYNIEFIINSFAEVQKKYSEAVLYILGDGSLRQELEEQVRRLGLSNVLFTGKVNNAQINEYLGKADIFISTPSIDNFPVSIMEAFGNGIPVISSNVGGIPYLIEDQKNGYLIKEFEEEEVLRQVEKIISNPQETKIVVLNARNKLIQFTWEKQKQLYLDLY